MDGDLIPKNNAADSGVLKSAANRYNLPYVAIFREAIVAMLHGLSPPSLGTTPTE